MLLRQKLKEHETQTKRKVFGNENHYSRLKDWMSKKSKEKPGKQRHNLITMGGEK